MIVHGWSNGNPNNKTGMGYGIRLSSKDRDEHFKNSWKVVTLKFDNGDSVNVKLSNSFWRNCTELRHAKIGKWMLNSKVAPWKKWKPPTFTLEPLGDKNFRLSFTSDFAKEYSEDSF